MASEQIETHFSPENWQKQVMIANMEVSPTLAGSDEAFIWQPDMLDSTTKSVEPYYNITELMPLDGTESFTEDGTESISWRDNAWSDTEENTISKPYTYVISHPGKDIRKQLLKAFNVYLNVDQESLKIINRVTSMLHNASLLIDDIQDDSKLRRGEPVAHMIFGVAQTINSANYTYFQAMEELYKLKDPAGAIRIYMEEMLNLHRGQGCDIFWRDTLTTPTEDDYLKMVSNKTGGLFRLALRMMMACSPTTHDVLPISEIIGRLFQIQDDYRNLCSDDYNSAKGFCEDLTEGKFSFLIIHAIANSGDANNEILNILKQKTENVTLKKYVLKFMREKTNTFEYTKEVIQRLHNEAKLEMARFDEANPLLNAILDKLLV